MSGQPINTQADANKFRNEYMENLRLQESNNDMNLQANKTYLLTGQLPPQSQLQDTRTNSEKLKDVENMKQQIASELSPIAESGFAFEIINKIISSPLNLNNSLFRFFAQRVSSIVEQLRKMYPYGIEGDENDVLRILEFIKNMYSEQQNKFQSTKSYMNSLSSNMSSSRLISVNDIDSIITQLEDIIKSIHIITQKGVNVGGIPNIGGISRRIRTTILTLKDVLPTTNQIKLLLNDLENPNYINPYHVDNEDIEVNQETGQPIPNANININPYDRADLEAFFKLMEKLPKYTEVNALIGKIKQYISSENWVLVRQGLLNLENMFNFIDANNLILLGQFRNIKQRQQFKENQMQKIESEQTSQFIQRQNQEARNISKANKVYIINPINDPVNSSITNFADLVANIPGFGQAQVPNQQSQEPNQQAQQLQAQQLQVQRPVRNNPFAGLNNPALQAQIDDAQRQSQPIPQLEPEAIFRANIRPIVNNLNADEIRQFEVIFGNLGNTTFAKKNNLVNRLTEQNANRNPPITYGIGGLGLKRRAGRPRGSGIKISVPKIPNFVGFGINEINQKQLDNGILKIRRNTKTNYMDMPSKHISKNLQGIIKIIIGGGVPKYDELGKLDNDEKEYLNKIVSRSNMSDKLSVPAPSKDQQEKDIHNFEVMKGEILSGNDSQELVKKFKMLVRKLSRQGLLPKNDVDELMDTLYDLGY